jgi:hypothetical protein
MLMTWRATLMDVATDIDGMAGIICVSLPPGQRRRPPPWFSGVS